MLSKKIKLLSLGFATLFSIAHAQLTSVELSNLLQQLDHIQKKHNIPAYAVVITDPNKILLNDIRGIEKQGSNVAIKKDAYFRIGSITKSFIGLSAAIAEREGHLKISDPISKYIDGDLILSTFKPSKDHKLNLETEKNQTNITLAHLLEHTAGLQDMSREEFDSNTILTLEQSVQKFAKNRVLKWAPGMHHSYTNAGYGLAGRALEVATKMDISQWLYKSIFQPLNMHSATLYLDSDVKKKLAPGYQKDGVETIPYWHMAYSSLGAINLQPKDMAKFIQLYLNRGAHLISPAQSARIELPRTTLAANAGLTFGYGLGIYQWQRNGHTFYGHGGDADGYLSKFAYQKQAKLGYFLVINTFNGNALREMERVVEQLLIHELPEPKYSIHVSSKQLEDYAGIYQSATSRFGSVPSSSTFRLRWNGSQLLANYADSNWYPLTHLGHGLFRYKNQSVATLAIVQDNTHIWIQCEDGNFFKQ